MALLALRAELTPVDIRVAIGALRAHVGKHKAGVAQAAFHFLVQAAEREAGLVVVEFRDVANRLPACEGVAVLALLTQITVRAARGAALRGRRRRSSWCRGGSCALRSLSSHTQSARCQNAQNEDRSRRDFGHFDHPLLMAGNC